jgi:hypothetical protein
MRPRGPACRPSASSPLRPKRSNISAAATIPLDCAISANLPTFPSANTAEAPSGGDEAGTDGEKNVKFADIGVAPTLNTLFHTLIGRGQRTIKTARRGSDTRPRPSASNQKQLSNLK